MPSTSPEQLEKVYAWQAANPDKVRANKRAYAKSDKGREAARRNREQTKERERTDPEYRAKRRAARSAAWDKNREKHRDKRRLEKYGISGEEYRKMLADQSGRCWICGFIPDLDKDLSVDHDHATNRVRGLLCNPCNLGLGNFRDNPSALAMAAKYLEVTSAR